MGSAALHDRHSHSAAEAAARAHSAESARLHGEPGYTIVELLVVVVVLGVLTVMMVPEFAGTHQDELLRSSARRLVATMQLAYSQAVTTNRPHQLRISPIDGSYWLEAPPDPTSSELKKATHLPGYTGRIDPRITIHVNSYHSGGGSITQDGDPGERQTRRRSVWGGSRRHRRERRPSPHVIRFRPDGTADPREIVLRDRSGFGVKLRVHPHTARIRILED